MLPSSPPSEFPPFFEHEETASRRRQRAEKKMAKHLRDTEDLLQIHLKII
jgi:hypothetical protein